MAQKQNATNQFGKGLNTDQNPVTTPNNLLTDCLNGTLITYDGNEFILQNDMGNYTLPGCSLSPGFVPVGMKSYGDVIYIASFNEQTKLCELGSYPSPKYPDISELDNSDANQFYARNLPLQNKYRPLWNFKKDSNEGTERQNFTTELLDFDLEHPVNIEIQPSYDGSVNLILNDDKNEPRIINSGFSIYDDRKVQLVKRDQKEATNIIAGDKFKTQTRLIKVVQKIPRFEFLDVLSTGQLKGGNYTFYLKMADGDYNKSEIVAESGQITVYKGTFSSINSVCGTLSDETTDKAIQLKIRNIDLTYPNFYLIYTREYSDLNGTRLTETKELAKPFEINDKSIIKEDNGESSFIVQIDGTESVTDSSEELLNISYIPVSAAKTQAQQQSMLFLGNIQSDTGEYKELQEIALKTIVTLKQKDTGIGWVDANYKHDKETDKVELNDGSEYYNPKNVYNYLGYWPEEYYRFGIVFINDDDTTTPAFMVVGKELSKVGDSNEDGLSITSSEWDNTANNNYIFDTAPFYNKNGIFKNPALTNDAKIQNYKDFNVYPWYYEFQLVDTWNGKPIDEALKDLGVKGYFITRQKRVPTILCQGMSISIDKTSHTPMLYDPNYDPRQTSKANAGTARFFNGDVMYAEDKVSEGTIPWTRRYSQDKYFTESFLAFFSDRKVVNNGFTDKDKKANCHMYLINDGQSILEDEQTDSTYTALGDHIVRTSQDYKQSSALLSLDPCVIPTLQSRFSGEQRYLKAQDTLNMQPVFASSISAEFKQEDAVYSTPDEILSAWNDYYLTYQAFKKQYIALWKVAEPILENYEFETTTDFGFTKTSLPIPNNNGGYDSLVLYEPSEDELDSALNRLDLIIEYLSLDDTSDADKSRLLYITDFKAFIEKCDFVNKYNKIVSSVYKYNSAAETVEGYDNLPDAPYGWVGGNVIYGKRGYYSRLFNYDTVAEDSTNEVYKNRVLYVPSGNSSKAIPDPINQEGSIIFSTVAGSAADVSSAAYFAEGINYRKKLYGAQYKYALRGVYTPILGIDDNNVENEDGKIEYPFLKENTIYNIYTDNYNPNDSNDHFIWFKARGNDKSPFYAVSDRYTINANKLSVYRGDCFTNTVTFRINRNFVDNDVPLTSDILKPASWGENIYDGFWETAKENWNKLNRADVNAVSLGMWVTFKCLSSYNLGLRAEDTQHTDEMALLGNARSFFPHYGISTKASQKIDDSWILNDGYNSTVSRKRNTINVSTPFYKTDYANRVMFSNISVNGSFSNGYRVFQGSSYRDFDNQYGEIVKLLPWGTNLFCVFQHGCAIIPVNEKALMQTTTQQSVHIYGFGVLPDSISILSQDFGSIWPDSVIRTPLGVYGIDSYAKKVWRYTDRKGFETISDMVVQRFLNDYLTVSETTKGVKVLTQNIKSHYNAYKGDIMFTFYIEGQESWNLCYNERQGIWITKYSWIPLASENINNQMYTFGLQECLDSNEKQTVAKLYLHGRTGTFDEISYTDNNPENQLLPTKWYGKQEPFEFEFVVQDQPGLQKLFDNFVIISNNVQPESIQFTLIGDEMLFNKARLYHESSGEFPLNIYKNRNDGFTKMALRGTIANPFTPLESKYLKNTKIQYDPVLDQYELVMTQETKNMETYGRRLGNIQYKKDGWWLVFDPIIFDENINSQNVEQTEPKWKGVALRDKWLKIKLKYKGDQLALITAITTFYRLT